MKPWPVICARVAALALWAAGMPWADAVETAAEAVQASCYNARTGGALEIPAWSELRRKLEPLWPLAGTPAGAERIMDTVLAHGREHGWPVMEVEAPEEIAPGCWRLAIFPGVVSGMSLAGGSAWTRAAVASDWARHIGQPLSTNAIAEWLDWLHRNPLRQGTLSFEPGAEPATAEGLLTLHSEKNARMFSTWRNDGVDPLGQHRFSLGLEVGDPGGLPAWLSVEGLAGDNPEEYAGARGQARFFLPWHHELRLGGGWTQAEIDGFLPGLALTSSLHSWDVMARYVVPLGKMGGWKWEAGAGVDFRRTTSGVSVAGLVVEGTADSARAVAELLLERTGAANETVLLAQGFASPGGITAYQGDAEASLLRAGAEADYAGGRLDLWSRQEMPGGWSVAARGAAQWLSAPVLPTEQLGMTGAQAVRGFDEAVVLADSGVWGGVELHAPLWAPEIWRRGVAVDPLIFADAGWGRDAAGDEETSLASAGVGLRARWAGHLSLALDYGWRLTEPGGRLHLSLRMTF